MKNITTFLLLLCTIVFAISSCTNDDETTSTTGCNTDFDQEAMFTNIADNLIIPAYERMQVNLLQLESETNAFIESPNQSTLENLRTTYLSAYVEFQNIAPYEFGPAETVFLRNSLNNFPTNTNAVEVNVENGNTDFSQPDNFDKGFPAIDYMLFGLADTDVSILEFYMEDSSYRNYLSAMVEDMKIRVDQTLAEWKNGYLETFVRNTGTAAGTSLSLLVNCLNENFELIKRQKLGIPSGVLTLDFVNPTEVEAFYSQSSVLLAIEALEATDELYKGKDGLGLDDYLQKVNALKGDATLDSAIKAQFTTMIEKVKTLSDPLSTAIEEDATPIVEAYNELAKQVVNLKTDLPSVLCVSITYIDNPSDSD